MTLDLGVCLNFQCLKPIEHIEQMAHLEGEPN